MPLDPLAKRFLEMMAAASPGDRSPSPDERRQAFAKLMRLARADVAAIAGIDGAMPGPAGDVPYRLYMRPQMTRRILPGFVFFHGGGMVGGSIETHDRIAAALAQTTGCRLVSVGYRLAPEHKFPAAIEDAIAATRWVSEQASSLGIDAARLVVGGDSAGATLAAVVCQESLRNAGPAISAQCLICPVLDFEETSPSRKAFAENHLLDRATLEADLADYLPTAPTPPIPEFRRCARPILPGFLPPLSIPPNSTRCGTKAMPTRKTRGGGRRGRTHLSRRHDP